MAATQVSNIISPGDVQLKLCVMIVIAIIMAKCQSARKRSRSAATQLGAVRSILCLYCRSLIAWHIASETDNQACGEYSLVQPTIIRSQTYRSQQHAKYCGTAVVSDQRDRR